MIGDTDHYFSPYIFGVNQACGKLGIWHSQVSLRRHPREIERRVIEVQPDLLWTHMVLWPPHKACLQWDLIDICRRAKKWGAHVLLHDGDPKTPSRSPYDLSDFVSLVLCNHKHDRSAWKVPNLFWPYAAFLQSKLADPVERFQCDVAFAGRIVSQEEPEEAPDAYQSRADIVLELQRSQLYVKVFDSVVGTNTMLRTAELAASATTVLGFGRSEPGNWVDTRVFQYPGAGGILIHDDVGGFLEPFEHYIPHEGDVLSIMEAAERVCKMTSNEQNKIRLRAFQHVQGSHSWLNRVEQVIEGFYE